MRSNKDELKAYVQRLSEAVSEQMGITTEEAEEVVNALEKAGYFTIDAPAYENPRATRLDYNPKTGDVTSRKLGNVTVNLTKNWKDAADVILSALGAPGAVTVAANGLSAGNPAAAAISVLIALGSTLLFAAKTGELLKLTISPKGAAILLTLRENPQWSADVSTLPARDALRNAVIANDGSNMNDERLQGELRTLEEYGCIEWDRTNGCVTLKERFNGTYGS